MEVEPPLRPLLIRFLSEAKRAFASRILGKRDFECRFAPAGIGSASRKRTELAYQGRAGDLLSSRIWAQLKPMLGA
jgi:hypothetical protein